ncbi:MAG: DEAD/DEAH box helicase, partial [Bacteroidales bacterium]|nr:DEAD/DEAH box helicase [Bacteroidales bacterium]
IVPTRELALQITQHVEGLGYFTPVSSLAVFGGGDGTLFENEKRSLKNGADIVICTPGRMISHLVMDYVNLDHLLFLVLDEADRMLDMGFHDDIMKIIATLPAKRQNLLFSATMPSKIRELTRKIQHNPVEINIALSTPPEKIRQQAIVVYNNQKIPVVKWLVSDPLIKSAIVFCDTKSGVKDLSHELQRSVAGIEQIHSDLEQTQREAVMNLFRSRQVRVLVATDIIARGIDVDDIDLIINYNVPRDAEDYVHRIGRTARAENEGKAITLIVEKEYGRFAAIERFLRKTVEKVAIPLEYGKTPTYDPTARVQENTGRYQRSVRAGSKSGGRREKASSWQRKPRKNIS